MSSDLGTAILTLKTDDKDFDSGLDRAQKKAGGLKSALGDVSKIAGGFVVAQGLMQIPELIGGFVGSASDMNEVLSKSNTVFKDNADEMEAWADGAARNFGQSKKEALEAASGFGNMFDQLGIGSNQAADMSQSITELASDFASFHNADISEVLNAQSAAFRGEYDSLQKFLPLINAATVEQKAMEETGKKNAKQLTAQDKALATYKLMLEGAGEAAGDFDRTSNGLANRQRILAAEFENIKAKIGQALLPVMVGFAGVLLDKVIPAITKVSDIIGNTLGPVIEKGKLLFDAFFAAGFGGEGVTSDGLFGQFEKAGIVVKEFFDDFKTFVRDAFTNFKTYWESDLKPALDAIINRLEDVVNFIRDNWSQIQSIIEPIFNQVKNVIETNVKLVLGILKLVIDLIQGDFKGAWNDLKELVGIVFDYLKETVENFKTLLQNAVPIVISLFEKLGNEAVQQLITAFEKLPGLMEKVPGLMIQGLRELGPLLLKAGREAGEQLAKGVADGIKSIPGMIKDALIPGGGPSLQDQIRSMTQQRDTASVQYGMAPWYGQSAFPGNASGTDWWRGGRTWVGENGPELVDLPAGSRIFSNEQSMGGGVTINMPNAKIYAQDESKARASAQRYGWAVGLAARQRGVA